MAVRNTEPFDLGAFDIDDSGAGEPLIPPHFDECPRCGGNGHETYLVGDMEHSLGRCTSCGGLGEIEVETFPVDDSGAMVHEFANVQVDAARAELEAAAAILSAGPLPADKRARNAALFARIEGLRADIRAKLDLIETLAARGVPMRFIPACQSNDDVRMDAAFLALRVLNQRHAEAMVELRQAPTNADAADLVSALAADIYEVLRQNGRYTTFDDLAAHFGTNVPRVVLAVKQLELAGERSGARIIRSQSGAEIDDLAQLPAAPIRAGNVIGRDLQLFALPGGGFYATNMRRPKLRRGSASIGEVAKRLVELGVRPAAGRAG